MIGPLLFFLAFAAVLVQVGIPLHWWPVDLPFLIAAFAGLARGGGWGLSCGLLSGFVLDTLLGGPVGLRMAPLAVAGALADALQPGVNRDQPRLQVLAVMALLLVHDGLLAAAGHWFNVPQYGLQRFLFGYALPRLAAQALACLPAFWVLGFVVRQRVFLDPRQRQVKMIRRWP